MPHVTSEDAMSKALHQISQSPFSKEIKKTDLLRDLLGQLSQFMMAKWIPWSTSVITMKAWPYTLKTRP